MVTRNHNAIVPQTKPLVYLAGGFYSDWRQRLEAALPIKGFDPARDNDQTASFRFVGDDLRCIESCDFVIAYYPGGYRSMGMAAEIGYACALRKPVIYIDETDNPDLFLVGCSKRLFTNIDSCIAWYKDRLANGRPVP